jgi:hypothetical protein
MNMWNNLDIPEYDLETDELIYRDRTENEVRKEKYYPYRGDVYIAGGQHRHSGLHPGGKEFSLLRSKNPICETAGWIAIL